MHSGSMINRHDHSRTRAATHINWPHVALRRLAPPCDLVTHLLLSIIVLFGLHVLEVTNSAAARARIFPLVHHREAKQVDEPRGGLG